MRDTRVVQCGLVPLLSGVTSRPRGVLYVLCASRAIRYGHKLGLEEPFFHTLVPQLASVATWGAAGDTPVKQHQVRPVRCVRAKSAC